MPKFLYLLFLSLFLPSLGFCQTNTSIAGDVVSKYKKAADKHYEKGAYNMAFSNYSKIADQFTNDPIFCFRFGKCILETNFNKETAIPYFEKAILAGNIEAIKLLGLTFHDIYKFDEALEQYQKYIVASDTTTKEFRISNIKNLIRYSLTAKELVDVPVDIVIENLGKKVNSEYADYVPIVTADDQEIVFTSRRPTSTGGNKDENNEFFEDIFYSERDTNGVWQHSRHISGDLNSHSHDAVAGLSADGQTLLVYQNDEFGLGGDLYMSTLRDSIWSKPIKLSDEISRKETWEPSATLTANEDAIYFSSDRPGGFGGLDLYISKRLPNGKYGEAKNLGSDINTKENEDAPFISADGNTLYFSSKGHKNMGGYDVFKADRKTESEWNKPENMGYPINTPDDDIFFTINAEGTHGYYSSLGADSHGEKDIYMIKFKPKPKNLAVLKGKVTNIQNNAPVAAQIFVTKSASIKLNGLYNSNAASGKYLIILQPGFSYQIIFKAETYHDDTLLINAQEIDGFNEVIKNVKLRKINLQLPDSLRNSFKEQLVIGKKEPLILPVQQEVIAANIPKLILIDTNGTHQELARKQPSKIDDQNKKSTANASPLAVDMSVNEANKAPSKHNFHKDCEIDFTNQVNVLSFNFGYKMKDLKAQQYKVLDSIIVPQKKKVVGIKINAHTDNIGSVKYNMVLSQMRSKSIVNHLRKKGINTSRIVACFYGETRPLVSNFNADGTDNADARYKNRRAEIEFFMSE
ncbi:MAG: OmpA family protein [Cytophagales bacterium]